MALKTDQIIQLLREFQKIDPEFPLQYAVCLLEISKSEGCSLTHITEKTGMPLSTVSRIVGALSKHRQKGPSAFPIADPSPVTFFSALR